MSSGGVNLNNNNYRLERGAHFNNLVGEVEGGLKGVPMRISGMLAGASGLGLNANQKAERIEPAGFLVFATID